MLHTVSLTTVDSLFHHTKALLPLLQCMCECVVQIAMSEHLKTLEVYHISTIPKLRLPLDVLFAASLDRGDAENLFQHLRTQLRKLSCISATPRFT